jgi:integrase
MGRDRPTKVEGTPRGLGLYRRQGRDGFFFIKNWSHLSKEFPGVFEHNGQYDEWIRRPDGSLVGSIAEAKAYCQRRNGELSQRKLSLQHPHTVYSGEDLQAIGHALADQWIREYQRGRNLQNLNLDRWSLLIRELGNTKTIKKNNPNVVAFVKEFDGGEVPTGPLVFCPLLRVSEEELKIQRLCLDQGYNPSELGLKAIFTVFRSRVNEHIAKVAVAKNDGVVAPPQPSLQKRGKNWENLLDAKKKEGLAPGTVRGISNAVCRLRKWLFNSYKIQLPTGLDADIALEYREFLVTKSGLRSTSSSKELRYLQSVFNSAVKQGILDTNPFQSLPRDRSASIRTKMDSVKNFENEGCIDNVEAQQICQAMQKNKHGKLDPSFDVFFIQAMTGCRIQEVAGLRRCDFVEKRFAKKNYKCIKIVHWEERGLGALGARGGLKTVQSQRIIPLPERAHKIWERYFDPESQEPAFPQERPKNDHQNWGDNLKRRMRDKCKDYPGTHGWRRSLINNSMNNGFPARVVEMVTGKTGHSSLNEYTSDDLQLMLKVVELNAKILSIMPDEGSN